MSVASMLFSLPHFLLDDYKVAVLSNSSNNSLESDFLKQDNESYWIIYMILMAFIASAAFMPLYTTGNRQKKITKIISIEERSFYLI